jgi:acyl carrier protein
MTSDDIFSYIDEQFGVDRDDVDEETGLLTEGILDSFSIVDLVLFIENSSGIKVNPSEVNLDNLDSVSKILSFVKSKQSAST